jgi:YesN/AraC family two-component response regulator
VKSIVFSGYSNKPIVAQYKEYGFDAKLVKPVSVQQLARTLKEIISERK